VRLLHKLGQTAQALALAQAMQASPQSADEAFFAQDFLAKLQGGKRTRSTTDFLKKADTLTLAAEHRAYVEGGVVAHWQAAGWQAAHTENWVWDALFALLLWEALFDGQAGGIHQPLQRGPSDLRTPEFYAQRQARIGAMLGALPDAAAALARAQTVYDQKAGTANPLIGWGSGLWSLVQTYLEQIPWSAVQAVLGQMAQNLKENARGFPDLFVWNDTDYFFAEVKSPNDHLSAQQLFWLQFFAQVGIPARVIRVAFAPEG
jgi:VRR-NUC domain